MIFLYFIKNKLKYNIEIKNGKILQMEAPKGEEVSLLHRKRIEEFLMEKGILKSGKIKSPYSQEKDYLLIFIILLLVVLFKYLR